MNNDPRKNLGGGLTPQKRRRQRAATTAQKTAAGLGAVLLVFGTVFFVQGRSGKGARNRSTAQNAAHASTAAGESIEALSWKAKQATSNAVITAAVERLVALICHSPWRLDPSVRGQWSRSPDPRSGQSPAWWRPGCGSQARQGRGSRPRSCRW